MKRSCFLFFLIALVMCSVSAQEGWKMVQGKITTEWAAKVDPQHVLPEYPRPQLVRKDWTNLNGLWQYSILPKAAASIPITLQGNILVPFAVESALSGVGKAVGKDSILWYKKIISLSPANNKRVLLHFGAVDWQCTVFLNGTELGTHKGGYDPFSFDITAALKKSPKQEIVVRVWDPTDDGPQPRGKQVRYPEGRGIWYTAVTGIWQTVWLEQVPETYISSTTQNPDIDRGSVAVGVEIRNRRPGDVLVLAAFDGHSKIAEQTIASDSAAVLSIPNQKLWSPETPFLYDLTVTLQRKGKTVDQVNSYFGMRKISMMPDEQGIQRMLLNDKFLFEYGPLDQGWWPDGLYTAPTDEALRSDIEKTKEMGFNLIRKHVKVEPARWYRYCDQIGLLVWQDMPSGDMGNEWDMRPGVYGRATDRDRTPESETAYRTEWGAIVRSLHNFPSIVVWTPFNEAWGQFKTREIVNWTMLMDSSRLVNTASGGNFTDVGSITDLHNYPEPLMPDPALFGKKRVLVLGEFGGLGLPIEGHTWQGKDNWGYVSFNDADTLFAKYSALIERIPMLIGKGLSAAVYTQTTDVEAEVNGLMTYDRKIMKMPANRLKALHEKLYSTKPSLQPIVAAGQ